jgi:hypothetical protein
MVKDGIVSIGIKTPEITYDNAVKVITKAILEKTYVNEEYVGVEDKTTKSGWTHKTVKHYDINDNDMIGINFGFIGDVEIEEDIITKIHNKILKETGKDVEVVLYDDDPMSSNCLYVLMTLTSGFGKRKTPLVLVKNWYDEDE